ncbi:MAG: tight adherence protein [Pseudonocardiales bacterium]|nr:tight adherence protein [Pseudonocardiales bacterium]
MVTPLVCLLLAAAALCAPGPVAGSRLAAMGPVPATGRRRQVWGAAPLALAGAVGLLVAGPGGGLTAALIALTVQGRRRRARASSATGATAEQLADALRRITDELRAGSHPAAALAGIDADGPLARDILAPAAAAARLGDDVSTALRRVSADRPDVAADIERVTGAWSLSERHGIPLAELLAGAHEDLRWGVRFGNTVRAQLAGPRATATVLTALPAVGLGLGQLLGADPLAVLRGGVLGQILLVVGVGLAAAGRTWTERILRSAVPR